MFAFPAIAALVSLICAGSIGWDALKRPRPERIAWTIAFLVFALAAGSEVLGAVAGWTPLLARIYYLTGAVIVVGLLAVGELYLLFGGRMPSITPGIALLVIALAATVVWSAPIDMSRLETEGWAAIERGPALIALAASINASGTLVLVAGAIYSTWKLWSRTGMRQRAVGCVLIAVGTIVVASGGTLTRFGHREYLYLAMAAGIVIIFAGIVLTRGGGARRAPRVAAPAPLATEAGVRRAWLTPLPAREGAASGTAPASEGIAFLVTNLLPLDDEALAAACRRWSASPLEGEHLNRSQAIQVWALRQALPPEAKPRLDRLPLVTQAQLAELYAEVWSRPPGALAGARHA